ncbi:uncharacterized protein LOC8280547 [Ricinus communis]|uniref:Uncharacterized protein n=1 Tax=Ricinus communis TaxID=3988 RepID=B9RUC0_RICCO|nr:uncharacterized protein LOC8280547 [Ricinus communis]EEF44907.1 conserved hypothetical protein [Ricinus communis]|eukprot:XP_002517365.1 uncharacterized protein LOC8280547 [Ricinus communis]
MSTAQASDANINDDIHETAFAKRRCCFCIPFLNSQPSSFSGSVFWQRINPLETSNPATPNATATTSAPADAWWVRGWKRMREWSEIVAGPKWKTLIRKISKRRKQNGYGNAKFRYDPLSYALNFDEGPGQNGHFDEDLVGRGFSSRYSLPPSCKTSLDFDREGIVVLT